MGEVESEARELRKEEERRQIRRGGGDLPLRDDEEEEEEGPAATKPSEAAGATLLARTMANLRIVRASYSDMVYIFGVDIF